MFIQPSGSQNYVRYVVYLTGRRVGGIGLGNAPTPSWQVGLVWVG